MKRLSLALLLVLSACVVTGAAQTFDLQAEINAAPNGGTVIIPCGVYDIGDVVIASDDVWQKVVTIQGCGHAHLGQAASLGNMQWDYLISRGYTYGTFLRGTISVKKGTFPDATTAKAYFRDFSLIGYDGTGIGIDYGDGVNMYPEGSIEDVSIGNFDIGIRLRRSYYMSIDDVSMAGVGIGLQNIDSNVITVNGLNITTCQTGVDAGGNGNSYIGGSVQVCEVGFNLRGSSSILGGYYFEQNGTSLIVSGTTHTVMSNYYAGNGGTILISGVGNEIFAADTNGPVTITGWRNWVKLSRSSTVCVNTTWPALNKCKVIYE